LLQARKSFYRQLKTKFRRWDAVETITAQHGHDLSFVVGVSRCRHPFENTEFAECARSMPQAPPTLNAPRQPVMMTTVYDKASAGMLAIVAGLLALTGLLAAIWLANRLPASQEAVPIELVATSGGFEDGNPDDSPELESPEEEIPEPAIEETSDAPVKIEEMLETIVELSDSASQQVDRVIQSEASGDSGKVGPTSGTDGVPMRFTSSTAGVPRELRWMIKFDDGDLVTYAKQLDFFNIELGALFKDGRLIFIKDVSRATPTKRQAKAKTAST
jgi:hypothetical protein